MATERQLRLFEAMERKPYPLTVGRSGRKEAVLVGGKFEKDQEEEWESGRMVYLDTRQEQQHNARRRRIYENQYNRPYPTAKNIQARSNSNLSRSNSNLSEPRSRLVSASRSFDSEDRISINGSFASPKPSHIIRVEDQTDLPPLTLPKDSPPSRRMIAVEPAASTSPRKNGKAPTPGDLPPRKLLASAFNKFTECTSGAAAECGPILHDLRNCAETDDIGEELSIEMKASPIIEMEPVPTTEKQADYVEDDQTAQSKSFSLHADDVEDDQTAESKSVSLIGLAALSNSPPRSASYTSLEDLVRHENEDELMGSSAAQGKTVTPDRDTRIVGEQVASPTDVMAINSIPITAYKKNATIQPSEQQDPIVNVEENTGRSVSSSPVSRTEPTPIRKGGHSNESNDTKSKKRSSSDSSNRFKMTTKTHESYDTLHNFLRDSEDHTLKLYIDDYQESTFDRIVESFYGNTKLKTLAICRGGFHVDRSAESRITRTSRVPRMGTHRTNKEMRCLFEAMRCLPNLHTLLLWNVSQDILTALAENLPRRLRKLNLHLAAVEGATIPDELLEALASKKHLKNVQFESFASMDIGRLLYSKSLETIEIVGDTYEFDPAHIMNLADAISETRHQTQLVTLDLAPEMDPSSWGYLAEALQANRSVQFLRITCYGDAENSKSTEGIAFDLAQLIRSNRSLTHAMNFASKSLVVSSTASTAVIEAIQENDNLLEFDFFKEDPIFWATKQAILKRNSGFGEGFAESESPIRTFYDQCVDFSINLRQWGKLCAF